MGEGPRKTLRAATIKFGLKGYQMMVIGIARMKANKSGTSGSQEGLIYYLGISIHH